MKFVFLALLFVLTNISLAAQTNFDSLYSVWLDDTESTEDRLNALYIWGIEHYTSFPDSSNSQALAGLDLAESSNLDLQSAKAFRLLGLSKNELGEYQSAGRLFENSLEIFATADAPAWVGEIYVDKGNLHLDQVHYDSALYFFDKAQTIFDELQQVEGVARILQKKSYTAKNQAEYDKAMKYGFEALNIWEKLGDDIGIANCYIDLADVLYYQENYRKAIEYSKKALDLLFRTNNLKGLASANREIGENYLLLDELDSALIYMNRALDISIAIGSSQLTIGSILNSRGNVYKYLEDYDNALADYGRSLEIVENIGFELGIMSIIANIGHVYVLKGEYEIALPYTLRGIEMMEKAGHKMNVLENYLHASNSYAGLGNYNEAYKYYKKYSETKDSIFTEEKDRTLSQLRTQYETEKKEEKILALEKEAEHHLQDVRRSRLLKILLGALALFLIVFAFGLWNRLKFVRRTKLLIQKEKDRSENLLLNILPAEIAQELKEKGRADAQDYELVSILFTDFKEFTQTSEKLGAQELVSEIHTCFEAFDAICGKYKIEKIKTIGDAYMAAGGLPVPMNDSVKNTVLAAIEMQEFISNRLEKRAIKGKIAFEMRAGIHTGPVVAGIVGVKKFQYDIWGDTVNTASRMESRGDVGKVNISQSTFDLIKNDPDFVFESRGKIQAKGKGEIEMYFVNKA